MHLEIKTRQYLIQYQNCTILVIHHQVLDHQYTSTPFNWSLVECLLAFTYRVVHFEHSDYSAFLDQSYKYFLSSKLQLLSMKSRLCSDSTVVECLTHNPKIVGQNPATGTGRDKMTKSTKNRMFITIKQPGIVCKLSKLHALGGPCTWGHLSVIYEFP